MSKEKKTPAEYKPQDCQLHSISYYAVLSGLTPARIYQMYQEDKIEIVSISGKQFVKESK